MDTPIRNYVFIVKVGDTKVKIHSAGKTRFLARKNLLRTLEESHLPPFEIVDDESPPFFVVDFSYSIIVQAQHEDEAAVIAYEKLDRMLSSGSIPAAAFAAGDRIRRL
jgi:hypothetical protein